MTIHRALDQDEGNQVSWVEVALESCSTEQAAKLLTDLGEISKLKHPNLIRSHAQWIRPEEPVLYIIKDLIPGNTLRDHLKKIKKPRMKRVQAWASQLLSVLSFLHRQEPVRIHGHLSPDRVYVVSHTGDLKVGSLGLSACVLHNSLTRVIDAFTAPDSPHFSPASDIYSFGMCLLEISTTETPYDYCTSIDQVMQRASSGVPPMSLNRIVDPQLRDLIYQCLLPEEQRPTADSLLNHSFFTLSSDDERLKSPVELRPVPAFETWEEPKTNESDERKVTISVTLSELPENQKVTFEFDREKDTPEGVAKEMMQELGLSKQAEGEIVEKIWEKLGKKYRPRRHTVESVDTIQSSPDSSSRGSSSDVFQGNLPLKRRFSRSQTTSFLSPKPSPSILMLSNRIAIGEENNEEDVKTLQVALNVTLKVKGTVDGRFSRQTAEMVRKYQESVGHLVTGVVTRTLWDMLIGESYAAQYDAQTSSPPPVPSDPASSVPADDHLASWEERLLNSPLA